jgi:hypothetical protein
MAPAGKNVHRLSCEPLERKFHDEWKKHQEQNHTLEYILGDNNEPAVVTDYEQMIVATVIQWLGSPVGQGFLANILGDDAIDATYFNLEKQNDS